MTENYMHRLCIRGTLVENLKTVNVNHLVENESIF